MPVGNVVYRCRLCGETFEPGSVPNLYRAVADIVNVGHTPDEWGVAFGLVAIHPDCRPAGEGYPAVGVADLIGIVAPTTA